MLDDVFLCVFEAEFAITALLASKSYNFDQNRSFMSELNVTREYQIENISLNERIKVELAVISLIFGDTAVLIMYYFKDSKISTSLDDYRV